MDTTSARAQVHQQLLELKMKHAEKAVDRLCEEAAARQCGYSEFLSLLLDAELVQRLDHCAELRLKMARFPFQKTLEQFDFNFQPTVDRRRVEELATLGFVTEGRVPEGAGEGGAPCAAPAGAEGGEAQRQESGVREAPDRDRVTAHYVEDSQ